MTVGLGLTVMVNVIGGPLQGLFNGVTVIAPKVVAGGHPPVVVTVGETTVAEPVKAPGFQV